MRVYLTHIPTLDPFAQPGVPSYATTQPHGAGDRLDTPEQSPDMRNALVTEALDIGCALILQSPVPGYCYRVYMLPDKTD